MALKILKNLFGDKSTKDRKEYQPSIDETNRLQQTLAGLSDDELRGKTAEFRSLITKGTSELEAELKVLKDKAADLDTHIQDKEDLFEQIDKMAKTIDDKIEEILEEIRPEAFAVVKETAKRWVENKKLEVTAQQFDKDLAAQKDRRVRTRRYIL